MPAIAIGINAAASAIFLTLKKMFSGFPLIHEEMPNFASQRRFVMIHKESIDAEALAILAKAHLGRDSSWIDIGNFLEQHVHSCLVVQSRGFVHPPLLRHLEVGNGEDPSDAYFI